MVPKNAGQIVKVLLQESGCQLSKFKSCLLNNSTMDCYNEHEKFGIPRVRRKKRR